MKITGIKAWQVDLPLKEDRYSWSNGNFVEVFDSTVIAIETDAGIVGHAECCPLGSAYLPAYAAGVRAGIAEVAPKLLRLDPTDLGAVNRRMDAALRGHDYVKTPIDVACWDILGKAAGMPVYKLLGGAAQAGKGRGVHYTKKSNHRSTLLKPTQNVDRANLLICAEISPANQCSETLSKLIKAFYGVRCARGALTLDEETNREGAFHGEHKQ